MIYGLFFKNTSYHVDEEKIIKSDFLYGEIAILEMLLHKEIVDPANCVPAISAFLGAKKLSIKKEEIHYALELNIEKILYFFDVKNIKFGYFHLFQDEINEMMKVKKNCSVIIYLPIDYFSDLELEKVLHFLSKYPFYFMVFIENKNNVIEKFEYISSKVFQFIEPQKIYFLFKNKYDMTQCSQLVKKMDIPSIAYLEG